jgi:hypothetical protein
LRHVQLASWNHRSCTMHNIIRWTRSLMVYVVGDKFWKKTMTKVMGFRIGNGDPYGNECFWARYT